MEDARRIIEKIKADLQNGKSDEEIFQSLLTFLEKDPKTHEEVAESLATIPDVRAAKLLHRMLERSEKRAVQKKIRRFLHRLKSRGIFTDEPVPEKGVSVLRPPKTEGPQGFGTAIDFMGRRLLVLAIPHPGAGLAVIQGVVSDTKGLLDVSEVFLTRKKFRFFLEDLQKDVPVPMAAMEPSYVGFLFTEAYELALSCRGTLPKGYGGVKREIENLSKRYERPLIYSHIQEHDVVGDDRDLTGAKDLLKVDVFAGWRIQDDEIRPYADAIAEANESRIILAQTQNEARFQEIYLKALSELFPGETRLLYKRRLEETAYLLLQLGRTEKAKGCLAAAVAVEKPVNPIQPNPFLFQLVVNSILGLLAEAHEERTKETSLIVRP